MSAPDPKPPPAYRIDGAVVAAEAFYKVACDPQRPVVVEACAGAGKTWILVSRILRALLDGALPQDILAITFTRKAAGEMRARLHELLASHADGVGSEQGRIKALQERGLDAVSARALAPALGSLQQRLQQGGRAVEVRTFHAWFSQLLKAAPLDLLRELGMQRDAQIVDDIADHESEVYRRFHGAVVADDTLRADYHHLVQRHGRSQLRKWLAAAWTKRVEIELADAAGTLASSVAAPVPAWPGADGSAHPASWVRLAAVQQTMQRCACVLGQASGKVSRNAASAIDAALSTGGSSVGDDAAMVAALWLALFTKADTLRKGLSEAPELQAAIDVLTTLRSAMAQHDACDEHLRMVRLSRVLFAELASYKKARGLVEMADLERCAVALLGDSVLSGWVQERLDVRVRHLLIDEFQDTSPLQWHALAAWLSGYVGAGGGASGQRAPSVFIVGDPKQSIYRFRRAEPKVFEAARDFISQGLGGAVLSCDHTRRNAPEVLAALNGVFSQAEHDGEFAGFRSHSTELESVVGAGVVCLPPVLLAPKGRDDADDAWRDTLSVPRTEPEQRLRQREADLVARAVRDVLARGVAPGEVYVLSRKRESLRLVAPALAALGVPCAAVEKTALLDEPEVQDLIALLDVLASPGHALSLAQSLKSPLFACSDDDLVCLATAVADAARVCAASTPASPQHMRDPLAWWNALQTLAAPSPALQQARDRLAAWQHATHVLPPHDLLDRIVSEGDLLARTLAAVPPTRRAAAQAAIEAVLAQSLVLDGARGATPYNFVRALRRRSLKTPAPTQRQAVQLLTIHGAKGLEAEVVFVMDTQPEPTQAESASLLVHWPVESPHPLCCAFVYAMSSGPPSLQRLLDDEADARHREELNGLYVAMTRAKHQVVLSATEPHGTPSGSSWWQRLASHSAPWVPTLDHTDVTLLPPPDVHLQTLPIWRPVADVSEHLRPPRSGALFAQPPSPQASTLDGHDDPNRRLGCAVHRVLEWATRVWPPVAASLDRLAAAAAQEFSTSAAEVQRVAAAILGSRECQRYFDPDGLAWAGNEVSVSDGGELLRIDRLVQLRPTEVYRAADLAADGVWWVLDYKLNLAPEQHDTYRRQLDRYRRAVLRLQPAATVRCAFITAQGTVVEMDEAR